MHGFIKEVVENDKGDNKDDFLSEIHTSTIAKFLLKIHCP